MILNKRELVELLEEVTQLIRDDDSFEGNISYTCMKEWLKPETFEVSGAFRHGNSMGQGGCSIIPSDEAEDFIG